ncbi:MAG TPA: phage tail terminator-like protein [Polyangiales bacterium]|nr:phage tail terminator-like protein [Polyangiales bacterium]
MTTQTEARDAVMDAIRDAWLADALTMGIALQWDNVKADPLGEDDDGNPLPWARVSVRHIFSGQETIAGPGSRKHQTEGVVTVQVFTPSGDGHSLADQIVEVLKPALRNVAIGNLWFYNVRVNELGTDGAWFVQNFLANFRYSELA